MVGTMGIENSLKTYIFYKEENNSRSKIKESVILSRSRNHECVLNRKVFGNLDSSIGYFMFSCSKYTARSGKKSFFLILLYYTIVLLYCTMFLFIAEEREKK